MTQEPVRESYFRNLSRLRFVPRIPVDVFWRVAFGTSKKRFEAADDKAYALCKVFNELLEARVDLNRECKRFNNSLITSFDSFLKVYQKCFI